MSWFLGTVLYCPELYSEKYTYYVVELISVVDLTAFPPQQAFLSQHSMFSYALPQIVILFQSLGRFVETNISKLNIILSSCSA